MIKTYFFTQLQLVYHKTKFGSNHRWVITLFVLFCFLFSGYAQKSKDIEPVVYCVKDLGNGLYQASFGYKNPTKKEVVIDKNGSIIKSNRGKKLAKGLNKFKPGSHDKAFTKEFGSGDYVEWTINSNGNSHTVIANANSAKKCAPDEGFIVPVIGNGKTSNIIGQELTSLCEDVAGEVPSELIFQTIGSKVLVEIIPIDGKRDDVISLLKQAPFSVPDLDFLLFKSDLYADLNGLSAVDAYIDQVNVCDLNLHGDIINFARPVYPANNNSGGVVSQGDSVQTSNLVRESFRMVNESGVIIPVDGRGITIGVLSDSYDMANPGESYAALDVANAELPVGVKLLLDNKSKASDEGRAMMQILHDVAPGAGLQFHTATASPRQFEVGFKALALECDIIVDDITFITEPFFGSGSISKTVQAFVESTDKIHFTSAGNVGNKAYQSKFNATSGSPLTNFIDPATSTVAHDFDISTGAEDYLQKFNVFPGTYLIALQWKEPLASQDNTIGASDDLDIYVVDDLGRLLVGSNRVNVDGDPTEIIVFRATGSGSANILITSANGPTNVPFRYIAFRTTADDGSTDGLTFSEFFGYGAPTISGHAMTPESVTVGAVDYRKAENPVAEVFSSYAGILSDQTILEVDLYAPDGANTASNTIGQLAICPSCDNDDFLNFYGTSASAPHAAAATALMMSASKSWFPLSMSPQGIDASTEIYGSNDALELFKTTSTKFNAPDGSGSTGGLLNTLEAFKSVAAQTAKITELIVEDGKIPSAEPFKVTILGEFFPEDSDDFTVLFDGQPLENVEMKVLDGKTVITASVPIFTGNPELLIDTAPKTVGKTDGGISLPAFFFKDGKLALNIIANNAQFEYGQDISLSYTVEGLPDETDFTKSFPVILSELGLPEVILGNTALDEKLANGEYPVVFDYVISPSFGELTYDQDLFQINFISGYNDTEVGKRGYLTISKKDLTIEVQNAEFVYGEAVLVELQYVYDSQGISNNEKFLNSIQTSHQEDFYDENSLILINKLRAVVNEQEILNLLNSGAWMASENTIVNKLRAVVNGQHFIDLEAIDFQNYIDSKTEDEITNKLRAVVNKLRAVVNGQDLLNNRIDLDIENKLRAVVNGTGLGDENDENDYSHIFAVIDADDGQTETNEGGITKLYAMNLLSGLGVTNNETEKHFIFPGAYLSSLAANFNITYASGRVGILPATLKISTGDLLITEGEEIDLTQIPVEIEAYVYEESFADVFPDGLEYVIINSDGKIYESGDKGVFDIFIKKPENYVVEHTNIGQLYINPFGNHLRKVRTYLDCIEVKNVSLGGLAYTAHFRYDNPNSETIYALHGADNYFSGPAIFEGVAPTIFLSGEGTFVIPFDGQKLIWNLTTFESTHKSSVSSEATAESGKCDAKNILDFTVLSNPFTDYISLERNIDASGVIEIFNIYGMLQHQEAFNKRDDKNIQIDSRNYETGMYIIRIATKKELYSFSLLKQ